MNMRKSLAILSGLLLVAGVAAALPVKDHAKVEINDTGFNPARMEVKVGQKIVWTNMSQTEHTVTSTDKLAKNGPEANQEAKPLFDSGTLKGGATWERVFDQPGTFEYFCQKDKAMKGTIVVQKAE